MITKLIDHRGDLKLTRLVVQGLLGTLNPSPTRYYVTPMNYVSLLIMSQFMQILDSSKLNIKTENAIINLVIMHL